MEARRMGRPPKTSRDDILDAAAATPADDLQLTTLAVSLGISVKTVYYYFATRKALLDALTERAVLEMGLPDVARAAGWRTVLEEDARWHYRIGASKPGWLLGGAAPRSIGIEALRRVCEALVGLGWNEREALKAHIVVSNWAVASGEAARRTAELGGLDDETIRCHLSDFADPATVDDVTRLMASLALEEVYEDGLKIVLAGIEKTVL